MIKNSLKIMLLGAVLAVTSSCEKNGELSVENAKTENEEFLASKKVCPTHKAYLSMLEKSPEIKLEEDRLNAKAQAYAAKSALSKAAESEIRIPVVVHVVYNTPEQNVKWRVIRDQIDALNRDFNAENEDLKKVPGWYRSRIGDVGIRFDLVRITRTKTDVVQWEFGTGVGIFDITLKSKGGKRITDPKKYLNIYIGNLSPSFAGIALSPSGRLKYPERDAVVLNVRNFSDPTQLGRTAVHEVGHWLDLNHLSGVDSSQGCSKNGGDMVSDTPRQSYEYAGFAPYPATRSCNTPDMVMNFMQSLADADMFMFTEGQKDRMRANFEPGGARETFK